MAPSTAATRPQLYALVNFMAEHTDLARGLLRGADARSRAKRLWEELCDTLNSMGGCCKSVEQWQRVWSDRKHLAKKNAAAARKAARDSCTSLRESATTSLSHLEMKIVSTVGEGFGVDLDLDTTEPFSPLKPSNDESDVEESPNNTYQEVVYLYDEDSKSTKKEITPVRPKKIETQTPMIIQKDREREKEKKEKDKTEGIERRKRRRMSVFVDEEPAPKPDEEDEEIDKFGKYVVCLMKTVPKELCAQLQMDMINLIMTAKIKYMAKPTEDGAQDSLVVVNEGDKVQHMQIADDGTEKTTEADATDQGTYEEVVYLQDSDTKQVKEIRLKKLDGPDKKQESDHRKRRLTATQMSDKPVDEEEIEKFGRYVTCLMKTIPNEINTQLQMDIINTIMRGKIKYMTKPPPVQEVIVEKVQTGFQPSIIVTMANEHMPYLESNTVVATQA